MATEVYAEVDEIVFTAPDRASVRFTLHRPTTRRSRRPASGSARPCSIDGMWKVSIETSCGLLGLAGIECDYSIEG